MGSGPVFQTTAFHKSYSVHNRDMKYLNRYTPLSDISLWSSNDLIQWLDLISFGECIFSGCSIEGIQGRFPFNLILQGNYAIILRFIRWWHICHETNLPFHTKMSESLSYERTLRKTRSQNSALGETFWKMVPLLLSAHRQMDGRCQVHYFPAKLKLCCRWISFTYPASTHHPMDVQLMFGCYFVLGGQPVIIGA